jgi:polyhydroxybutyrate depolymerase
MGAGVRGSRADLSGGSLEIRGLRRTYWLATPASSPAPLIVALHGLGMTGPALGGITGLATRGPAEGFAVVFPDGWGGRWDGEQRHEDRREVDDPAFISSLVERLVASGAARPGPVVLAGLSNGALLAEFLARRAVVPVDLLALVAGTSREAAEGRPHPAQPTAVVCFAGTSDPVMPYGGGPIGGAGLAGRVLHRVTHLGHGRSRAALPGVVGAEALVGEWAAVNGFDTPPRRERVSGRSERHPVTCLSWSAPGHLPVRLYRVDGGGHGWPGHQQHRVRVPWSPASGLDATGIILGLAAHGAP